MVRAIILIGFLASLLVTGAALAGEKKEQTKQDWLPAGSIWAGMGYAKDAKGRERERGRFALVVTSRENGKFAGTLGRTDENRGRVEVEGVITASNRVSFRVTKVVHGEPPQALLEAQFTGKVKDDGKRLALQAQSPEGAVIEMELTRDESGKGD